MTNESGRRITTVEPERTPPLDLFFAYVAMIPLVVGAVGVFVFAPQHAFLAQNFALLWGAAILVFLAGVRRGVSFRTPGGPASAQLAAMLWLFGLGVAALLAIVWGFPFLASGLELAGFVSLAVLDPPAARRGEAPIYFARLRPVQMAVPILALLALGLKAGEFV